MKRLFIFAVVCAALGAAHFVTPFHLEMTGLCWLAFAAGFAVLACLTRKNAKKAARAVKILMLSFLAVLIAGTGYIILGEGYTADTDAPPEYVVVLGAQIHGSRPSRTLRERLDKAAGYLEEHPEAFCVVTGGQGADETQTEASVMAAYLTAAGIDPDRIAQETQSENTRENLRNAAELAELHGLDASRVLIVTSEFHLRRASYIAGTLGLDASRLGSRTTPYILRLNYELREVFALVKAMYVAARA